MMILLSKYTPVPFNDISDIGRVVIHTANMIHEDWTNMTQAVWRSPLLPLLKSGNSSSSSQTGIGTGLRFKRDILAYLRAYGPKKTGSLVQQLNHFDFGQIRAALVASVPSKQQFSGLDSNRATVWGWPALRDLMGRVPISHKRDKKEDGSAEKPHIVIQVGQSGHVCRIALTIIRFPLWLRSAKQTNG